MTREEAIKLLKATNKMMHSSDGMPLSDVCEALDMAIEALQADTIKEDLVSVVRCKDCKASRVYGKTTQWLACESVMEGQATDPDGYCYLGERREK